MATLYQSRTGVWQIKYMLDGKRHSKSLKTHDLSEAKRIKEELEFKLHGIDKGWVSAPAEPSTLTVSKLAHHYRIHVSERFSLERADVISRVLDLLESKFGQAKIEDFGPKLLKEVREAMVEQGLRRKTCNAYTSIIKAMFAWGVEEEIVPETIYRALAVVKGLLKGRTSAAEGEKRVPVPWADVEATLAVLPPTLRALVLVQYHTGARPSEVCFLRPCDIDRSGNVWVATVAQHKNSWREGDKKRFLYLGKSAQKSVLELLVQCEDDGYLFDPRRAIKERNAHCKTHRRKNQWIAVRKSDRCVNDHYNKDSYRRAIERACKKAGIPIWTPYQLRHAAASRIEAAAGPQAARSILGHASLDTTAIYLHTDAEAAKAIMKQLG